MPNHYDERGNIPGPGGSRFNPIPRWQSEEDKSILEYENRWGPIIEDISKDLKTNLENTDQYFSVIIKQPRL